MLFLLSSFLLSSGQRDDGWPSLPHLKNFLSSSNFYHMAYFLRLGPFYHPFEKMMLPQKWVGSIFMTCFTCIGKLGLPGSSSGTDCHLQWSQVEDGFLACCDACRSAWKKCRKGNVPPHIIVSIFLFWGYVLEFLISFLLWHQKEALGVIGFLQ